MKEFLNLLLLLYAVVVDVKCRINGCKKLTEIQRVEIKQVDHADRIGFWFC